VGNERCKGIANARLCMRVARIMKEIAIAILVGETCQSPSTTTDWGGTRGAPRLRECGGERSPIAAGPKAGGDEECRLNERWFYD